MRAAKRSGGLLTLLFLAATARAEAADIDARANALLAQMTLEEKVGQLNLVESDRHELEAQVAAGKVGAVLGFLGAARANALQRLALEHSPLRIPLLFGADVIHGYRTIFPIPLALASTFDPGAVETMARISAREASAAGVRWTFSPMVDIARDPRWGRIAEGAGEDPALGAILAAAYVRGYQGAALSDPASVAACAKHFVGYGAGEGGRDYAAVDMSERQLREVYLPPFKAAADAGAVSVMSSFNTLNGVPATANAFTLRRILKGEWKFGGLVVSDQRAVRELVNHGVASNKSDAARMALLGGVDMDMSSDAYVDYAADLTRSGAVPMPVVDDAVRRILRVKLQLGLFERPYADEAPADAAPTAETRATARVIAQKSLVLLRNEGGLLPLSKATGAIAVIGPLADSHIDMLGSWAGKGEAAESVSLLDGLRAAVGVKAIHAKGVDVDGDRSDGLAEALEVARRADVVILALGESADMTGEAASRANLDLPGRQQELLEAIVATGKPVVLVLIGGRPLAISWAAEHVPAILEAWIPGTEGGHAIADVIFGDSNPSGRLPVSVPRAVGQLPVYYGHLNTGRPFGLDPPWQTGYRDLPPTPLYPFGYGLSYSRFAYGGLEARVSPGPSLQVRLSVIVTNAGVRSGEEVVQLYLRRPVSAVARPFMELKQFRRVTLNPSETRKLEFTLTHAEIMALDANMLFGVEPGRYSVAVGPDSANVIEAEFDIAPASEDSRP